MTDPSPTPMRVSRRDEQIDAATGRSTAIDASPLLGRWANANARTHGIAELTIAREAAGLIVAVRPAGEADAPYRASVDGVYASSVAGRVAMAFTADCRSAAADARLEGNLNLGLMVLAVYHTFRDGDPRASYFEREFFHQVGN